MNFPTLLTFHFEKSGIETNFLHSENNVIFGNLTSFLLIQNKRIISLFIFSVPIYLIYQEFLITQDFVRVFPSLSLISLFSILICLVNILTYHKYIL